MSSNLIHLELERRYWDNVVKPLVDKNGLRWDVQVDFTNATVTLKLIHPSDTNSIQKDPSLVSRIDVDRSKRSEEKIVTEIQKAIALRTHGK